MNWVSEFLDAPFFAQVETEKLFDLINCGRDVRAKKSGAFASISIVGSRATLKS